MMEGDSIKQIKNYYVDELFDEIDKTYTVCSKNEGIITLHKVGVGIAEQMCFIYATDGNCRKSNYMIHKARIPDINKSDILKCVQIAHNQNFMGLIENNRFNVYYLRKMVNFKIVDTYKSFKISFDKTQHNELKLIIDEKQIITAKEINNCYLFDERCIIMVNDISNKLIMICLDFSTALIQIHYFKENQLNSNSHVQISHDGKCIIDITRGDTGALTLYKLENLDGKLDCKMCTICTYKNIICATKICENMNRIMCINTDKEIVVYTLNKDTKLCNKTNLANTGTIAKKCKIINYDKLSSIYLDCNSPDSRVSIYVVTYLKTSCIEYILFLEHANNIKQFGPYTLGLPQKYAKIEDIGNIYFIISHNTDCHYTDIIMYDFDVLIPIKLVELFAIETKQRILNNVNNDTITIRIISDDKKYVYRVPDEASFTLDIKNNKECDINVPFNATFYNDMRSIDIYMQLLGGKINDILDGIFTLSRTRGRHNMMYKLFEYMLEFTKIFVTEKNINSTYKRCYIGYKIIILMLRYYVKNQQYQIKNENPDIFNIICEDFPIFEEFIKNTKEIMFGYTTGSVR